MWYASVTTRKLKRKRDAIATKDFWRPRERPRAH